MITFSFSGRPYQTERIIGQCGDAESGPVAVFFGGVHGNEPSGVIALQEVFEELASNQTPLSGHVLGVAGNLSALATNQRYIDQDLNRIWTRRHLARDASEATNESTQQEEIFELIRPFIEGDRTAYFLDLHTTSGDSAPFIAINDQLNNRSFAVRFPVTTVLGIEEFLEGPLLSYLNEFGPVALAFEAGQHDDPESVKTHKSFIYMALVAAGIVAEQDLPENVSEKNIHRIRLESLGRADKGFFEVVHKRAITRDDKFRMKPGFPNLAPIRKGDVLARDRDGDIHAPMTGRIFMPLYQAKGNDGFFVVKRIPHWAMWLSRMLRHINFDRLLTVLPGVSHDPHRADALVVNKTIARFLAKKIFHLLGYRRKREDSEVMIFSRREIN